MASQSEAAIETIALYASLLPTDYCATAVTALVVYDWIVTLTREVQLFWTGRARPLSAALYFTNKYLTLLAQVMGMIWDAPISDEMDCLYSCTRVVIAGNTITYLTFVPPAVFAGLRAYALTQRRWLSALVFLLSSIPVVTNMLLFRFNIVGVSIPILGCVYNADISPALDQMYRFMPRCQNNEVQSTVLITNRISTILADTVLIAITWKRILPDGAMKTIQTKGLAWVMLYDGMLYFVVLLSLNVVHLVLTELSVVMDGDSSFIGLFTAPLSSVLVSHFLLDLQEAYQRKVVGLGTDDPLHTSQSFSLRSINFTPALGSLGATIDPAHYGREDEDEDAHLGVPEDVPGWRPDGGGSSRDARIEDEFAIMEVPRPGGTELAIRP